MRIIGGEFRSRQIQMPKGVEIRPTQDKVREAIFNIIGDISGMRVLELFAGSGAFGIEALSRGAEHVTFVDNNFKCVNTIRSNLDSLSIAKNRYNLIRSDAFTAIPKLKETEGQFDIVFIDPPYYKEMAKKCLIIADGCDILSRVGFMLVEHFKKDVLPQDLKTLAVREERRYGDAVITIFRISYDKSEDRGLSGNV